MTQSQAFRKVGPTYVRPHGRRIGTVCSIMAEHVLDQDGAWNDGAFGMVMDAGRIQLGLRSGCVETE